MAGKLFLIPNTLGDTNINSVIPNEIVNICTSLKYFAVENIRTARRYLKKVNPAIVIDDLHFSVLDKNTKPAELSSIITPALNGESIGIISEAGCPGVADPGANLVELAHKKKIQVIPLVGPSSILLAMMASGLNGQSFAFNGYLPIQRHEKINALKNYELRSKKENQAQLFIETPYRNMQLLDDIIASCNPQTRMCIASDITLETEFIQTKTINEWKNKKPNLNKRPTIFIIQS
ncbi:MAG: SAM-dependent methyltransferase [Marinilabiliaceae bacterium]|nr:SAM-dependent methyltransferase [Marinilabiliaceae bacterium]